MKKLSELPMETLLMVNDSESITTKEELLEQDNDDGVLEDAAVYLVEQETTRFSLHNALETFSDEMYEDWLEDVSYDIDHSVINVTAFEDAINSILDKHPTCFAGEKIKVDMGKHIKGE